MTSELLLTNYCYYNELIIISLTEILRMFSVARQKFINLSTNIHLDLRMDWLDFGGQALKIRFTVTKSLFCVRQS